MLQATTTHSAPETIWSPTGGCRANDSFWEPQSHGKTNPAAAAADAPLAKPLPFIPTFPIDTCPAE